MFALDKNFGFLFFFYWGILKWVKFILAMNNANKFKINLENFVFIVCIILINSYTITATKNLNYFFKSKHKKIIELLRNEDNLNCSKNSL